MVLYLKEECLNMTQANKYISNIINSQNIGENIENKIIKELVEYHPTKQIDVNNIDWIKLKILQPWNKPALFYKNKNSIKEDDIAWKLCIRNYYGKYENDKQYQKDVNNAFRHESHIGTKKQYFMNNTIYNNNIFMGNQSKQFSLFWANKQYYLV
jgi:hypothetical protein